uniref:Ig-like domain-containing protein n=1 Tax=Oreochromis aureus TaxID=47969 RepID=A0AAZ1WX94_OREAU
MKKVKPRFMFVLNFMPFFVKASAGSYWYTVSTGGFIFVNGQEFVHYKSSLKKMVPKTEWIEKTVDPEYWEREKYLSFTTILYLSGVHILQWVYGCEWNEDTEEVTGFEILGYDGRDYVAFDLKTETYIASAPQAVITKHNWDRDKTRISYKKYFLTQECVDKLKNFVNSGRKSLMKTVPPSVSLLQKSPSSPISCHATGFFPNVAEMFWRKDGEELHEDVHKGEILPNNDETFQMSVDLKLSSVKPEDWERYDCVFQFSERSILLQLRKLSPRACLCSCCLYLTLSSTSTDHIIFFSWIYLIIILYFSSSDSKSSSDITIKTELMTSTYRLSVTHSLNLCVVLHVFTH